MKKYTYKKINFTVSNEDDDLITKLQIAIQQSLNKRVTVAKVIRLALRAYAQQHEIIISD